MNGPQRAAGNPVIPATPSRKGAALSVALFWVAYLVILVILVVTGGAKAMVPEPFRPLFWGALSSGLIWGTTLLFLRRGKSRLQDIGLVPDRRSPLQLGFGLAVGLAVFGLNILAVVLMAGLRLERGPTPDPINRFLVVAGTFATACMEELGFRAYALRTLASSFGAWPAQVAVAIGFGLCHLAFGWPWNTVLLGVIPSALLFGAAAVASGGIALPIGIHAGLNLARWMIGDTGFWRPLAEPQAGDRISSVATITSLAITLLTALAFWLKARPSVTAATTDNPVTRQAA